MEKIAFISDIHSNLPALHATINDIKDRGINKIYCLGDIVGYHSFPNEVIHILQRENIVSIKGNHDEVITQQNFDRNRDSDFVLYWNYDRLTEQNRSFLAGLPISLDFNVEGVSIKLVHGSPNSISEYIREDSKEADLYLSKMESDVLMCAHTHIPYLLKSDGKYLLNTGSIGKPKFGKPECSYIILTINGRDILPEIISLPYKVHEITTHLKENNFPDKLIKALESGNP